MTRNESDYGIIRDGTTSHVLHALREEYRRINTPRYFGLINADADITPRELERIVEDGEYYGRSWKADRFYVKKMNDEEKRSFPPVRMKNVIILSQKTNPFIGVPYSVGILYTGTGADALAGQSDAYFILPYVDGIPLLQSFGERNANKRRDFFSYLGLSLEYYRHRHIFHLDFAPGDIMQMTIRDNEDYFVFINSEHVAISEDHDAAVFLIDEQRNAFMEGYGQFLSEAEMIEALKMVFDKYDDKKEVK